MDKALALVNETKQMKPSRKFSYYLEDPKTEYLLTATDERGKTVYFFKMNITGFYDRVFGPYDNRAMAVDCFDNVLIAALESFTNCHTSKRNRGNGGMEHIALPTDLTPIPARKDGAT